MICDVEVLEIAEKKRLGGLIVHRRGEDRLPELIERNVRDARHALCHAVVALCGRRGFEHDGIGDNCSCHQSRQPVRRKQAALLIHGRDDRRGGAHGLIAEVDGRTCLDIGQPVVVDDLQNVRLLEPRHGLRHFIVIDEHDALAARL